MKAFDNSSDERIVCKSVNQTPTLFGTFPGFRVHNRIPGHIAHLKLNKTTFAEISRQRFREQLPISFSRKRSHRNTESDMMTGQFQHLTGCRQMTQGTL